MNEFQSNRITLFREQYDAISKLSVSIQGKVYKALMDYNFMGSIPKLDGTAQLAFDLIKAGLDVSLSKQRAGKAGGIQKASNSLSEDKQNYKSYEEIMDDLAVEEDIRPVIWEFIKHCQANGHTLINSKLTSIILALDYAYGNSYKEKIASLKKAINGGYFDVVENNRQLNV